ncbi:hypothetical protein THRCLA_03970 [Thraustotheca clavata]|uniref:Uncharacterized protein n=1 Tax=Thraustotheca clavata TaxID=74557 RepID=A0A1W0A0D4_9STRA|nr:hypothetical protein THRCLA_03970 [Thraustotheca clavata]
MGNPDETNEEERNDLDTIKQDVMSEEEKESLTLPKAHKNIQPEAMYSGVELKLLLQQANLEMEQQWKKKMDQVMETNRNVQLELVTVKTERELLLQTHEATKTALRSAIDTSIKFTAMRVEKLMSFEEEKAEEVINSTTKEALEAALEVERKARESLANECLKLREKRLQLTRRISVLEHQIVKYQQTETVLAQSISHFQHRVDAKEHQRAEDMERLKGEIGDASRAEIDKVKDEYQAAVNALTLVQSDVKKYQEENERLSAELEEVKQNIQNDETLTEGLRARVIQLETEKAVLQSKADQLQKADASLRYRVNTAEQRVKELQAEIITLKTHDSYVLKRRTEQESLLLENAKLTETNNDLNKIASDLMALAEGSYEEQNIKRQKPN